MVHRASLGGDALAVLAGPLPTEPLPEPAVLPRVDAAAVADRLADRLATVSTVPITPV